MTNMSKKKMLPHSCPKLNQMIADWWPRFFNCDVWQWSYHQKPQHIYNTLLYNLVKYLAAGLVEFTQELKNMDGYYWLTFSSTVD